MDRFYEQRTTELPSDSAELLQPTYAPDKYFIHQISPNSEVRTLRFIQHLMDRATPQLSRNCDKCICEYYMDSNSKEKLGGKLHLRPSPTVAPSATCSLPGRGSRSFTLTHCDAKRILTTTLHLAHSPWQAVDLRYPQVELMQPSFSVSAC